MPIIHLSTKINAPKQRCFDLSRSIDLHQISASKTKEYVVDGRASGLIALDETVTWRAKHFGVWQNLKVKITGFDEPHYFCDEMLAGAFKRFSHKHHFKEEAGQTLMVDIFDFESPFWIIGKIFNQLVLTNYMRKFLIERNEIIKSYAESEEWKDILH